MSVRRRAEATPSGGEFILDIPGSKAWRLRNCTFLGVNGAVVTFVRVACQVNGGNTGLWEVTAGPIAAGRAVVAMFSIGIGFSSVDDAAATRLDLTQGMPDFVIKEAGRIVVSVSDLTLVAGINPILEWEEVT